MWAFMNNSHTNRKMSDPLGLCSLSHTRHEKVDLKFEKKSYLVLIWYRTKK